MMAISRSTLCLFWLLAIAPLGAEAAGLRARGPTAKSPATSAAESMADVEDAEDEEDSDQPVAAEQPAVAQLLMQAALPEEVPAVVPQPVLAAVPQLSAPAVPAASRWMPPAAVPKLPVAEPETAFQFSPPRTSVVFPSAVAPKVDVAQGKHAAAARTLPSWLQSNASSQEAMPANWPPSGNKYNKCDPPCIQGRGFCNDNVCFCRSPYSGSTCQHKTTDLYRAPKVMVVGFALTCFVLGIVMSKIIFSFSEHAIETRLQKYGRGKQRFEMWQPPEDKTKNKAPPAKKVDTGM